jgi:hypothetical protein
MTDWLRIHQVKSARDLDRLHPHDYAELASKPASGLEILRVRLEINDMIERLNEQAWKGGR